MVNVNDHNDQIIFATFIFVHSVKYLNPGLALQELTSHELTSITPHNYINNTTKLANFLQRTILNSRNPNHYQ